MIDGQRKQLNGTQASAPSTRTNRTVGRQKKRWEDEVNDFLKPEETEETKGNEIENNDTWIKVAKNRERWKAMETNCAVEAASLHTDPMQEDLRVQCQQSDICVGRKRLQLAHEELPEVQLLLTPVYNGRSRST